MTRVAIVGGGPGGLMSAYLIARRYGADCRTTLFEGSDRLGGKLSTRRFATVPACYEAGTAECYDYTGVGDDPLLRLVHELGLATSPMRGQTVVLDGTILRDDTDILHHWGEPTLTAIREFRRRAVQLVPRGGRHDTWQQENAHPWASRTCDELLDTVADPVARKYLAVESHADLATEPQFTNALNGIRSFAKQVPGQVAIHTIEGGMSRLARRLTARIGDTMVSLNTPVVGIEHAPDGTWHVRYTRNGRSHDRTFDAVVLALPVFQLGGIEYAGVPLRQTMRAHIARYDRPGHYLRVSLLFRSAFWQQTLTGSWFMIDAFGGACVYDESARYDAGGHGVLGFLIAGNDAHSLMNVDESTLVRRAIEALPATLQRQASDQLMEAAVHRWCRGVCAQPGGRPLRDPQTTHRPDPARLAGLLLVGDYQFDCTLNGVYRSADLATTLLPMSYPGAREPVRRACLR